jgi:hypothetical protein
MDLANGLRCNHVADLVQSAERWSSVFIVTTISCSRSPISGVKLLLRIIWSDSHQAVCKDMPNDTVPFVADMLRACCTYARQESNTSKNVPS